MKAIVTVMLKEGVLDAPGRAIGQALHTLGFTDVADVRAGRVIELKMTAANANAARIEAEAMARKLLANTVIESYRVTIEE